MIKELKCICEDEKISYITLVWKILHTTFTYYVPSQHTFKNIARFTNIIEGSININEEKFIAWTQRVWYYGSTRIFFRLRIM